MRVECPGCRQALTAPDDAAGRRARCKACKTSFVIQPPAARPCPRCSAALDPSAIVCHRCGVNLETGLLPKEVAGQQGEDAAGGVPRLEPARLVEAVGEWLPGLFRPGLLILAILCSLAGFVAMGYCLALLAFGLPLAACMVGGLGLIVYGQGLAMLIQGETGLLHELLTDMDGKRWTLFLALLFAPFVILYFVLRNRLPH